MGYPKHLKNKGPQFFRRKRPKHLQKRGSKNTLIFTLALALVLIFATVTLASYIYKAVLHSYLVTAGDFHFTSNLLTDDEVPPAYQITHDWQANNKAAISFELRNYENSLNVSKKSIAYTVKAEAAGSTIAETNGTIAITGSTGKKKTISLQIERPASVEPFEPLEVAVTAASTSPYAKTLRGKFVITPAISYQLAENAGSPVAILTITLAGSEEPARNVTITWGEGAAPDMTNPLVIAAVEGETIDLDGDSNGDNKSLTTALNTAATYELVFFKDQAEAEYTGVTAAGSTNML